MQYFASYYWQHGEKNTASLVLQQVYHKKKRSSMLLTCISQDGGLSEKLADWFYETGLSLYGKMGEKGMAMISDSMNKILLQTENEAVPNMTGMLCVGHYFQMFQKGVYGISLLNSRYQHAHCCDVMAEEADRLYIRDGEIEKGVGILLATKEFRHIVLHNEIEECLNIRELRSQDRMDKRLKELGTLGEERKGKNMGAVLLVSR